MSLTVEELSQALAKELAALLRQAGQEESAAKLSGATDSLSRLKLAVRLLPGLGSRQVKSADTSLALATAAAVLERAFVESIEGSQLMTILKELILRMDHELMAAGSQGMPAIDKKAVDASVQQFFKEVDVGILL